MRRLAPRDRFLGSLLLLVWAICLALAVESRVRGPGLSSVIVAAAESADAYPTFVAKKRWYGWEDPGLEAGDALIRAGATDLRGMDALGFTLAVADQGRESFLPLVYERDGTRHEIVLRVAGWSMTWPALFASLVMGVTVGIALLRARPTPLLRAGFGAIGMAGIWLASRFAGPPPLTLASFAVGTVSVGLLFPLVLRAALLFPHGRPPTRALARYGPWLFVVQGPIANASSLQLWLPPDLADTLGYAIGALLTGLVVAIFTRAWRRADAVERRQIQWVVWGVWVAGLPVLAAGAWGAFHPTHGYWFFVSLGALAFIPITLLIATLRYDLFDIDRIITATASYNLLAVVFVAGGLVFVPRASSAAARWLGISPETGQVALSLLLAGALVPMHARLRPRIERVFFRERATLHDGVEKLLGELSSREDSAALLEGFAEGVAILFGPVAGALYTPAERDGWQAAWLRGSAVPPTFPGESRLVRELAARRQALDLTRRTSDGSFSGVERASLATLDVEVVVPVRRGKELAAFLCLGPKASGDIYTHADLALLSAVADKVSTEFRRFEHSATLRQEREMQENLRRYVPGAVADTLARREALEDAEREIAVLFCDIRGYTAYAEGRGAAEVFSTINRYTERASDVVRARGGSVVEFLGDGLMAVFGAPVALEDKEHAAVAAGREIVRAVEAMAGEGETAWSVGVGIATGTSFVGSIRTADRAIWTAIGNPVNLASRLQALTRELDAAIAIDADTHAATKDDLGDFTRATGVKIKGRSTPLDVWFLARGQRANR